MTDYAKLLVKLAKDLFKGVPDLHTECSVRQLFKNFVAMKPGLQELDPRIIYRSKY